MKLCKDCRFCRLETRFTTDQCQQAFAKCAAPLAPVDPINGAPTSRCENNRLQNWLLARFLNRCSTEARWFQPKE